MNTLKRCLTIAYAFPPCGGAGVQRTAKFVKYLPEFGWQPTVLTVDPSCYGVKDDSHGSDLPTDVEVIRTWHFDPVAKFTCASAPAHTNRNNGNRNGNGSQPKPKVVSALRAIARHAWVGVERNLLIPDQALLWYPRAVAAGLAALRKHKFDLIFATGEPYSAFLIAMTLSRLSKIPFVIDMRDPWTLETYRNEVRTPLRDEAEQWQERKVLEQCAAAVFANRASDLYTNKFPELADRFHYIPNGYDSRDFDQVEPKRFDRFTIIHSGTFLPGYRTADTFLLALRRFVDNRPDLAEKLQVIFVGKIGDEAELLEELRLGAIVRQTGYVPHSEAVAYLKGADLLLLVGGGHRWEETGKIYEYFASGRPVLGLVRPDGAAASLLSDYGRARIVDRESQEQTAAALTELLEGSLTAVDQSWSERFERKRLTEQLAEVFDSCVQGRPAPHPRHSYSSHACSQYS